MHVYMHTQEFSEAVKVGSVKSRDLIFLIGSMTLSSLYGTMGGVTVDIAKGRTNHFDSVERFLAFCFSAV